MNDTRVFFALGVVGLWVCLIFASGCIEDPRAMTYDGDRGLWDGGPDGIGDSGGIDAARDDASDVAHPDVSVDCPLGCDGIIAVATRQNHTCALREGGTVACWGENVFGQLGDGTYVSRARPADVLRIDDAVDVSVSYHTSCVVHENGDLSCWGHHGFLELGDIAIEEPHPTGYREDTYPVAKRFSLPHRARQISLGALHACALVKDNAGAGRVWCWGWNRYGNVGTGSNTAPLAPQEVVGLYDLGGSAKAVASGLRHGCALMDDDALYCWGENRSKMIAPEQEATAILGPTLIPGSYASVSVGMNHLCAVDRQGELHCWGRSVEGQHGPAQGLTGLADVALGLIHTCVRTREGQVDCMGQNNLNVLATQGLDNFMEPLRVDFPEEPVVSFSSGLYHVCALVASGNVYCWGNNDKGQLGNGVTSSSSRPLSLGLSEVQHIAAGTQHACALHGAPTRVSCWGLNSHGQSGDERAAIVETPRALAFPEGQQMLALSLGDGHSCALGSSDVFCWGKNDVAQLGRVTGSNPLRSAPQPGPERVALPGSLPIADAAQLSLGDEHGCLLMTDGVRYCWGSNLRGQIHPQLGDVVLSPASFGTGLMAHLATGRWHTCLHRDALTQCFGLNDFGQAGNATLGPRSPLTEVPGISGAVELTGGGDFTCGRVATGQVSCWGNNSLGQLAGFLGESIYVAQVIALPSPATQISAGHQHACALLDSARVACWGSNANHRAGGGEEAPFLRAPELVADLEGVEEIAAGGDFTCARHAQGVSCWGNNAWGQLGSAEGSPLPVAPVKVVGF